MKYDLIVVGGGIVGLATSLKIKQANPDLKLLILEKEKDIAIHQTGHNSGVIHSGLYYKPGSLKATNCIRGYTELVQFCQEESIPYELCGKIVVATAPEELPIMDGLYERGVQNGLTDLKKLSAEELKEYEPHVNGLGGILVPQTGIVNYKVVAQRYLDKIKNLGGEIVFGEKVIGVHRKGRSLELVTDNTTYQTNLMVNCAGLYSDKLAKMTLPHVNFKIIPFRGEYYQLSKEKEHLVKNLIYPVPDPNFPFLGVHFTRMIGGGIEAGPNAVLAFRREGYTKTAFHLGELGETLGWPGFQKVAYKYWRTGFGEMYRSWSKAAFTKALQKLMPEITENDLIPGGAGVRAQACDKNGGLIDDFLILEGEGVVNVCNAPSPAATSSLSIGQTVADLALKRL